MIPIIKKQVEAIILADYCNFEKTFVHIVDLCIHQKNCIDEFRSSIINRMWYISSFYDCFQSISKIELININKGICIKDFKRDPYKFIGPNEKIDCIYFDAELSKEDKDFIINTYREQTDYFTEYSVKTQTIIDKG